LNDRREELRRLVGNNATSGEVRVAVAEPAGEATAVRVESTSFSVGPSGVSYQSRPGSIRAALPKAARL
jgi:hypothetical protein